jgi:hypothetical protein
MKRSPNIMHRKAQQIEHQTREFAENNQKNHTKL